MDRTVYQAIEVLTAGLPVEYQQSDGSWSRARPASIRNSGLVHEAGTLWMGDDPATSVTDPDGRMHRARNVYGTGSMLFPRPGSFNPTYTGVTMAFGLAERLTRR
jgi:choline dehydrogenase-like flavoprotein